MSFKEAMTAAPSSLDWATLRNSCLVFPVHKENSHELVETIIVVSNYCDKELSVSLFEKKLSRIKQVLWLFQIALHVSSNHI